VGLLRFHRSYVAPPSLNKLFNCDRYYSMFLLIVQAIFMKNTEILGS
jgi:hypothetical protein